ncbi:SRR1-like protein [Capsaspora owczarzaki ATCC 30864]|uniref:SRR1-like protein n=1 Tax=Capsaspora owczarzaki (strain ATCC 30864) TaxID=595528 RepID=UPI0003520B83|nr:SRR1-like protein [Capsaspora owczarzaki ATCC 30864]|eukprot:XP_004364036.2 SRR1-like protein [Capsaspora owczarzaki ATCC 30864]
MANNNPPSSPSPSSPLRHVDIMQADGFTLASGKRRTARAQPANPGTHSHSSPGAAGPARAQQASPSVSGSGAGGSGSESPPSSLVVARVIEARKQLEQSDFLEEIQRDCFPQDAQGTIREIVCYGIGSLSDSVLARYQFALCLALQEHLKIPGQVHVFDPVFTVQDIAAVQQLGGAIISENEEAKRKASVPTLFYMPHCGGRLYNNLLWANWSPAALARVLILGNPLSRYAERMSNASFQTALPYIAQVLPAVRETPLPSFRVRNDVFNDTSVVKFNVSALQALPEAQWSSAPEPVYDVADVEFISAATVPSLVAP